MTTTTRDSQRSKVYDAEHEVRFILTSVAKAQTNTVEFHGSTLTIPTERNFGDVAGVQNYVDSVLALNWVRSSFERAKYSVKVRERAGMEKAHYEPWTRTIAVPVHKGVRSSWAMREIVVLHELAHHLDGSYPAHGPQFVATLTELVEGVLGSEVAFLLRTAFLTHGARSA